MESQRLNPHVRAEMVRTESPTRRESLRTKRRKTPKMILAPIIIFARHLESCHCCSRVRFHVFPVYQDISFTSVLRHLRHLTFAASSATIGSLTFAASFQNLRPMPLGRRRRVLYSIHVPIATWIHVLTYRLAGRS